MEETEVFDEVEEIGDVVDEVEVAPPPTEEHESAYIKGSHSYIFVCSKCGAKVFIFSDISNRVEDKKSLHRCKK